MISLSQLDIDRMRKLALYERSHSSQVIKNEQKHSLSKKRVEKWPNTLEAIRKKKEDFLVEREAEREKRFAEVDIQEQQFRAVQRQEALERAAKQQNDQTEQMKLYRSQKLCADVLDTVAQQIIEKEQRKEREQNEKNAYHQLVLQQIKAVEKIEERSKDRKKKMTQSIALTRSQQRDEVKLRKEQEKEEQQLVGQALQNQAKQDLIIATQHTEAEKIRIKQANELMIQYNESLKSIRSEIRKQESITQNERDGEAAVIEKRNADRKHIECVRQENRNKKRVDLVEMTTLLLQQTQQKENEMLFKQMEEIKQYQDQEDAMKLAKKKQEWDDTIRSRQLQIDRKQRDKERKRIEDDEQIQIFLRHNQQELEEDKEKIKLARDRTIAIKNQQYTDSIQSKEAKAKIKLQEKEEANILMNTNSVADDDSRFIHMCQEDIAERKQQGKTVYPLLKALTKSHKSK